MLMNFLKKWVNRAIFSSHRAQTSRADASPGCSELTFWGNKGVLLRVNYLSGFKLYLCVWMRNCVRAWNGWTLGWSGGIWGGVGGLPVGLTLINWGLVRFVGISVLKWASVSSSPSPGASRGYLVVIPSHFLGFFRTLPFIPKEMAWKGSVFRRLLWQKWHCGRWCDRGVPETTSSHAPSWFNVPQLHQKSLSTQQSTMRHLLRQESRLKSISERNEGSEQ